MMNSKLSTMVVKHIKMCEWCDKHLPTTIAMYVAKNCIRKEKRAAAAYKMLQGE